MQKLRIAFDRNQCAKPWQEVSMPIHEDRHGTVTHAIVLNTGQPVEGYEYIIKKSPQESPHLHFVDQEGNDILAFINFQMGNPAERGVNGLTEQALLSILLHRLDYLNERNKRTPSLKRLEARKRLAQALVCLEALEALEY